MESSPCASSNQRSVSVSVFGINEPKRLATRNLTMSFGAAAIYYFLILEVVVVASST